MWIHEAKKLRCLIPILRFNHFFSISSFIDNSGRLYTFLQIFFWDSGTWVAILYSTCIIDHKGSLSFMMMWLVFLVVPSLQKQKKTILILITEGPPPKSLEPRAWRSNEERITMITYYTRWWCICVITLLLVTYVSW